MPLSATFITDFSAFYDAVNKAKVSLSGFNTEAEHVGATLSSMADKFSGKKILEEGAAISRLFQTVDDVAILTDKELKQLGATTDEVIEKMERMGVAVPDSLKMVSAEAHKVGAATTDMSGAWSTFAGMLGVNSVEAVVGSLISFGKEIIADADALQKMSDRTGIAVEDLQDLQVAGDDAGVSIESMANAVNVLQERVAK